MDRTDKILDLLSIHKTMSIHQLSKLLFCSTSSLRRDLISLESTGAIRRIRGGATLVSGSNFEYSCHFRSSQYIAEKDHIADIARDFLTNGMSLFLDGTSTVSKLCPHLNDLRNITVATNGLLTGLQLNDCQHVESFLTGGYLGYGSASLVGEEALQLIKNMRADIAFLSCRGLDAEGVYEANIGHAHVKQQMIQHAKKTILLVDNSKFDQPFFHRLASFSQFHAVITDQAPSPAIREAIESQDCLLLY